MIELFNTVLYEPLLNALIFLYHYIPIHDIGFAIIALTIVIKLILFVPSMSSIKSQKALQDTQPKLEELKKKYKDNKEELSKQLIKFYKDNKVNPFSSCLPLIIQLPILIALYRVFFNGLQMDPETGLLAADQIEHLYSYLKDIYNSTQINTMFLGFVDLSKSKNIILAVMAGAAQFWQSRMLLARKPAIKSKGAKDENIAAMMNKQMIYFMPLITIFFGYQFPAGLTLYWLVSTFFMVAQQYYFFKKDKKDKDKDNNEGKDKEGGDKQIIEGEAKVE